MSTPASPEPQDSPGDRPAVPPPPPAPGPVPAADNPYAAWQQPGPAYPWVPPPPPPPRRSPARLITAVIVAAVLVVCGVVVWASNIVQDHNSVTPPSAAPDTSTPSVGPSYQLSVPETLLGGTYTLSANLGSAIQEQLDKQKVPMDGMHTAGGQYRKGAGTTADVLTVWGAYGQIPSPAALRAQLLAGAEGTKLGLAVGTKDYQATGSDRTFSCEVLTVPTTTGRSLTMPICVWDDDNVAVLVTHTSHTIVLEKPSAVDLQAVADLADKVVNEVRVPIGASGGTAS